MQSAYSTATADLARYVFECRIIQLVLKREWKYSNDLVRMKALSERSVSLPVQRNDLFIWCERSTSDIWKASLESSINKELWIFCKLSPPVNLYLSQLLTNVADKTYRRLTFLLDNKAEPGEPEARISFLLTGCFHRTSHKFSLIRFLLTTTEPWFSAVLNLGRSIPPLSLSLSLSLSLCVCVCVSFPVSLGEVPVA